MRELLIFAEVMDKEPTIAEVWIFAICASAVMFVLSFVLSLAGKNVFIVLIPIGVLLSWICVAETWDVYVGPAILKEAGVEYVLQCHLAATFIIAAVICGRLTVLLVPPSWIPKGDAAGHAKGTGTSGRDVT